LHQGYQDVCLNDYRYQNFSYCLNFKYKSTKKG